MNNIELKKESYYFFNTFLAVWNTLYETKHKDIKISFGDFFMDGIEIKKVSEDYFIIEKMRKNIFICYFRIDFSGKYKKYLARIL